MRLVERRIAYEPLPSQKRFHESEARFKGFSGPIGSGKSQALVQEAIRLAYVNAGRTGLLGAPTYPMLRDATQSALLAALDKNGLPYELNKAEQILTLTDTRSRILFRAVEEFDRLRGTNLAWFGVDELTYAPEEAWLRLEGRLRDPQATRLCGFGVWTPKGRDWVWRKFVSGETKHYEVILAAPYENRFVLDRIPDFYERLKSSYNESFFAQEVLGEYVHASEGLVYFAFDRQKHVAACEADPQEVLLWALDFNVTPMSSVVAQRGADGLRVLDEIVLRRSSTREACEEFLARWGNHGRRVRIYGDASGRNRRTTGSSDFEIVEQTLAEAGLRAEIRVPRANPPVRERTNLVNALLGDAGGGIRLRVDARCRELIRDFEEVRYKPGSTVMDKDRDPDRTHVSDALGYLVCEEFGQRQTAGERPYPLGI